MYIICMLVKYSIKENKKIGFFSEVFLKKPAENRKWLSLLLFVPVIIIIYYYFMLYVVIILCVYNSVV